MKKLPKTTEKGIIEFLKLYGIINKNKFAGEYVLPRPLANSDLLERKYKNDYKPETEQALTRARMINQYVKRKYDMSLGLLIIKPFGKTYKLSINVDAVKEINKKKGYED